MMPFTDADLDMGDALLAAVRLHAAGDIMGAGMTAIPAVQQDPILAAGILGAFCADAVRAYADAIGLDPVAACDRLWTPPSRAAGHVDGSGVRR